MKILFVCTGNTCRSPMAEVIFNKLSKDKSLNHSAISRGTAVFMQQPMNTKSKNALNSNNFDVKNHTSLQLTLEDIEECDLVLTMTSAHKIALKNAFPKFKSKIYDINEKAYGKDSDIEDPYGKEQEAYDKCFNELLEAIEKIICLL